MNAVAAVRTATPDDMNFIRASWFESFRMGGCAPQVQFPVYRFGQNAIIERILAQPTTKIVVAYATAEPTEICSWACCEGIYLHYAYTKQAYRKMGFAAHLVKILKPYTSHTHETRAGRSFAARLGTKYNPYPLYKGL